MASSVLVAVSIMFLFVFSSSSQASPSYEDGLQGSSFNGSEKVNVSVYYDSLCPHCANFIVQKLESVFENNLISIINLRMVPWGNAYINKSDNKIVCQHGQDECLLNTIQACAIQESPDVHGQDECLLNTIQACAIRESPDVNMHFGLIHCIEFLVIEGNQKDWENCFDSLGFPNKNGNGTMIELQYANETAHLNPPLTFVPWVVVNNQSIKEDYDNFASYICKAYKGNPRPNYCALPPPPPMIDSARKPDVVHPICYTSEAKTMVSSIPAKKVLD